MFFIVFSIIYNNFHFFYLQKYFLLNNNIIMQEYSLSNVFENTNLTNFILEITNELYENIKEDYVDIEGIFLF